MENTSNQKTNPSNQSESHPSSSNTTQSSPFLLKEACSSDSFSAENHSTLMRAKQILYPSFFSTKGLAQDILEVTEAELDVPLDTFIRLYPLGGNPVLKNSLTNLFGTCIRMGILHSPEHLMGDQDIFQLPNKLPHQEKKVFEHFDQVTSNIDNFKEIITSLSDLEEKEAILKSLQDVRAFYNDYKTKILALCQAINEKSESEKEGLAELSRLVKPKATMFGEIFPKGQAYRISREIARHILSLNSHQASVRRDSNASANHSVSHLPFNENPEIKSTPRVFFKANGMPPLQPGKDAMLSSLYRLLNIPAPRTGLLLITGIHESNPAFYAVQASEAVLGKSPKHDLSWEEELKLDTKKFESFCQQVIGAILTNPSDGKPANFIYHKEKYGFVSIDNDDVFYNDFSATSNNEFSIQTKSLLFCLEFMEKPIPRSLSNFLTALDIGLLLLTWLDELKRKNQEYEDLESVLKYKNARQIFQKFLPHEEHAPIQKLLEKPILFHGMTESLSKDLSLPITVSKGLCDALKIKLLDIAKVLSDPANFEITSQGLLEKISPHLGLYYKNLRSKFSNPLKAIKAIWSTPYSLASSLMDISGMKIQSINEKIDFSPEDLFETLKQSFKECHKYQLDRLIRKYGAQRKKYLLQPEEALKEMWCLLRLKLTTFEKADEIVDFWFKGREIIKNEVLIEQWDNLFFLFSEPEFKWLFAIEKHFTREWKNTKSKFPEDISDIKGAFSGKRSLSKAMMNEIFDKSRIFKKEENLTGRSQVAKFPKENPIFYLKKSPEIPGYDYAATLFMRSFGLEGVPFSDLLLFKDPKQGLYSVLLTEAVPGDPLDRIWKDDRNFSGLDPHHTYLLILCSMLLNPEDGKGDNYILTADKRRIIPIDNDHVFLPGTIQEEKGFFTKTVYTALQSKIVLYCLREMNESIPPSVIKIITGLDIDNFLDAWLRKLVEVNEKYQTLPPENYLLKAGEKGAFFRIAFHMDYIKNLYTKFIRMKQLLLNKSDLTPFELLQTFEPFVGNLYKKVFHEEPTVEQRFMKITEKLLKKDKNGHQISRWSSIEIFKILNIPRSELVDQDFLCKQCPQNALEFLLRYREQRKQQEGMYQKVIRGEAELQKTDLSKCTEEQEKTILDLAFKRNKEAIALLNSKLLDGKFLSNIFDSFISEKTGSEIRLLNLRGTQKLNSFCLLLISAHLPNIEYLNIGDHPKLNSAVFLGVNFSKMKRLVVTGCPELSGLIIESSLLDVLEVRDNPKLENVLLYTPNLTYFDFTANGKAQIHMFKSMESLQLKKPSPEELEKVVHKIDTLEVIQNETDSIIEKIAKDIATEQCLVSEKRNQEIKDDMPDIAGSLLTGPVFYLMSKALVGMVSFMINDSYAKRVEKLQPKVKEMIRKMVNNSFKQQSQKEKNLGDEKEIYNMEDGMEKKEMTE